MNSDTISIRFIIEYYCKMSHIARFSDIQFCIFCAMILRKSQNLSIDRYVRLLRIFRILLVLIQSFITKMICRQILTQKSKLFFFYNKKIKLLVCFFVPQNQSNRYIQWKMNKILLYCPLLFKFHFLATPLICWYETMFDIIQSKFPLPPLTDSCCFCWHSGWMNQLVWSIQILVFLLLVTYQYLLLHFYSG